MPDGSKQVTTGAVGPLCPDCGCHENGWNPKRHEFMETWARCCGYPERDKLANAPAVRDSSLQEVLQALYRSEINASVSCFWDGGWDVKLGDQMNGYAAEDSFDDLGKAAEWLISEAVKIYPESAFAREKRNARV